MMSKYETAKQCHSRNIKEIFDSIENLKSHFAHTKILPEDIHWNKVSVTAQNSELLDEIIELIEISDK